MNFFQAAGIKDTDSFFRMLDREYYKANPEEWDKEGEFIVKGLDYTKIIQGNQDFHIRKREKGERSTAEYIERDGYHVWEAGREYDVKHHDFNMRDVEMSGQVSEGNRHKEEHAITINPDGIIGRIRLIYIEIGKEEDKLIFEVVELKRG